MLTASGLSVAHGTRVLFRDVTLTLGPGRRVALVGGNGVGKTTMLECIAGIREPDEGQVHRPRDLHLGYLPQDLTDTATGTVLEEALGGTGPLAELAVTLEGIGEQLATHDATADPRGHADLLHRYGEAQSRFEQLGGYAREAEAHQVLAGLGFAPADSHRSVRELSGGWRMRVALARLLVEEPDLLVLDEPTNHLDVDSVAWLEEALVEGPSGLLFVSYDRDFIDAVAERVIELSGTAATEYVGGFAEFVRLKPINVNRGIYPLPDNISFEEGSFVEPLACVVRSTICRSPACSRPMCSTTSSGSRWADITRTSYRIPASSSARTIAARMSCRLSTGGTGK